MAVIRSCDFTKKLLEAIGLPDTTLVSNVDISVRRDDLVRITVTKCLSSDEYEKLILVFQEESFVVESENSDS